MDASCSSGSQKGNKNIGGKGLQAMMNQSNRMLKYCDALPFLYNGTVDKTPATTGAGN
jgi:hypothetical protein